MGQQTIFRHNSHQFYQEERIDRWVHRKVDPPPGFGSYSELHPGGLRDPRLLTHLRFTRNRSAFQGDEETRCFWIRAAGARNAKRPRPEGSGRTRTGAVRLSVE
ncbi:hypothetical protein GCM10010210_13120 [Pseudonocardia hydrocarbonoxydans]|uniref:Uncharacterized protein n=1 Tax=Pseudonocardia hydrocarbonoxydans TaxID=76726 RepID=A0A4Y3WTC3_9PSEU|nr:hypothetical protein PHY01_32820 [Pseudonocardia hydrocarbonoxydans]